MSDLPAVPTTTRVGAVLALCAILFGFILGGVFGFNEAAIKGRLDARADAVMTTVYNGDVPARNAVVSKSWDYLKRAHLHGGGIGAAALATILAIVLLGNGDTLTRLSSLSLGAGALLYAVFWLMAGFRAPGLGSTAVAKESLAYIAVPGAGLSLLGVAGAILIVLRGRHSG